MRRYKTKTALLWIIPALTLLLFSLWLYRGLSPLPSELLPAVPVERVRLLDRYGTPITFAREDHLNTQDIAELHTIPLLLRQAIIMAEDKRFFLHNGTDWKAVGHALLQNIRAGGNVRGASSITEQVIRILNPRPRTFGSRMLESIDAYRLEKHFSKADILAFYLNQVPYPDRCRGVVQAADRLFDRDLSTLDTTEILILAVLPRAPQALHPAHHPERLMQRVETLARRMVQTEILRQEAAERTRLTPELRRKTLPVHAPFFVRYVRESLPSPSTTLPIRTSLDGPLQKKIQGLLDARTAQLAMHNLTNGAVLVLEHRTGRIRAWAVAGNGQDKRDGGKINAPLIPRQPGSALKPFAYAMALERGWTAATPIADTPISTPVGRGSHDYQNYSRNAYGIMPLRDALANSLNLAAIRTVRHVGVESYLATLRACGLHSLTRTAGFYGDGLVLGNGEVSLLELTRAYAILARDGRKLPLHVLNTPPELIQPGETIFQRDTSRLIALILSDPEARRYEFGPLMAFPVQTAIKTGTSSDHRDAWAFGFDHQHTVGIWMGNLDRSPMHNLAGASGPVPLLRSVFRELNRNQDTKALPLPQDLVLRDVCIRQNPHGLCTAFRSEWMPRDAQPASEGENAETSIHLQSPMDGLLLTMDPRIAPENQKLPLRVSEPQQKALYRWYINGVLFKEGNTPEVLWPLQAGTHEIRVRIDLEDGRTLSCMASIQVTQGQRTMELTRQIPDVNGVVELTGMEAQP
ncbi:transglycosylase domain-containing protein [Desulfobotulus sp. H1]|uniref:peptidoglycan glycosyltransferase n=1 Tax=Desulfobotulus pelophilus TaxID=2823377 RepID=A0ABT3N5Y9_9BACT|nr:transglycosylase domain-containing protein [Desulfobotulus pelophilus]MCW7752877.1 transglycosylase domain-containing protein [Desulfobotulus pelophilus]